MNKLNTSDIFPRGKVLVAEDDDSIAFALNCILEIDFDVRCVSEGNLVLAAAVEFMPDVVIMDISLPGHDGFTACRQLRMTPETAGIPVVFLTSSDAHADLVEAFATGAADFVRKPFSRDEVVARITSQVRMRRADQERLRRLGDLSEALAGLQQSYFFFADHTADVLIRCGSDGTILHVNRSWATLVGGNSEPVLGARLWDLAVAADQEIIRTAIEAAIASNQESLRLEFSIKGITENEVPLRASLLFRYAPAGQCLECNVVLTDISEYVKSPSANRASSQRQVGAVGSVPVDRMAHELRTPLNAVQSALTHLRGLTNQRDLTEVIELLDLGVGRFDMVFAEMFGEDTFCSGRQRISRNAWVLLVDDLPVNLRILTHVLRGMGFNNIEVATSGEQALEMWTCRQHALVLTDYEMGGMSGYDLGRAIRAHHGGGVVSLIGVSACVLPENANQALAAGIDAELAKPVSRIKLARVFESLGIRAVVDEGAPTGGG